MLNDVLADLAPIGMKKLDRADKVFNSMVEVVDDIEADGDHFTNEEVDKLIDALCTDVEVRLSAHVSNHVKAWVGVEVER